MLYKYFLQVTKRNNVQQPTYYPKNIYLNEPVTISKETLPSTNMNDIVEKMESLVRQNKETQYALF